MAKKGGKGKNNKKSKKVESEKRELILAGEMEEYAKVMKPLGDRRLNVSLIDGTEVIGHIPGRFRKSTWIKTGDVILVARRAFQVDKVDILHKYSSDEARKLFKKEEIPKFFLEIDGTAEDEEDEDIGFIFDEDDNMNTLNSISKTTVDVDNL